MDFLTYLKKYKFSSFLVQIIALIFVLLLLSNLLLARFLFTVATKRINQEVNHTNQEILVRIETLISSYLGSAINSLLNMGGSIDVRNFALNYTNIDLFTKSKVFERISERMLTIEMENPLIYSVYFYLEEPEFICSSDSTLPMRLFYDKDWFSIVETKVEDFGRAYRFDSMIRTMMLSNGQKETALTFFTGLPLESQHKTAYLLMNIQPNAFEKIIAAHKGALMDRMIIKTEEGFALYQSSPPVEGEIYFSETISEFNNWTYRTETSLKQLSLYMSSFRGIVLIIVAISIGIGLVVSLFISLRIYAPFILLHSKLDDTSHSRNSHCTEIGDIKESLEHTISEKLLLDNIIRDNSFVLKNNYLQNLLNGHWGKPVPKHVLDRAERYGCTLDFDSSMVFFFMRPHFNARQLNEKDEIMRVRIARVLQDYLNKGDVCIIENNIGVLMNIAKQDTEWIQTQAEAFIEIIGDRLQILVSCIVSVPFSLIEEAQLPFREVLSVNRRYPTIPGGTVMFAQENEEQFILGEERIQEGRDNIIAAIKQCNQQEAKIALGNYFDLLAQYNLSIQRTDFLFMQLVGYLELEFSEIGNKGKLEQRDFQELYKNIAEHKIDDTLVTRLYAVTRRLIHSIWEHKNERYTQIISQAVAFIESNYHIDISLENVADSVGLSAPYVSKVFREYKGVGFKEFICRLRIDKAVNLLQTTDKDIQSIYEALGFTNLSTFYRVFKKVTGRTPDSYRHVELS